MLLKQFVTIAVLFMVLMLVVPTASAEILENHDCFVFGKATYVWTAFDPQGNDILKSIGNFFLFLHNQTGYQFPIYLFFFMWLLIRCPVRRQDNVGFGDLRTFKPFDQNIPLPTPATGWIKTIGKNGTVEYEGKFWGDLGDLIVIFREKSVLGMTGFTGITKPVLHPLIGLPVYFIGYAEHVRIETVE